MYSYFGDGEFFDQEETRKYSAQCASQESEVFFIDKDVMIYLIFMVNLINNRNSLKICNMQQVQNKN